jgi:hypothetical protein
LDKELKFSGPHCYHLESMAGTKNKELIVDVHMSVNGKMRPVETIPGMGGVRKKENDGGG